MTQATIDKTPAQARKATAAAQVQKLTAEREQRSTRQRTAVTEVERLNGAIAVAVQARDETGLATLRKACREQQETIENLNGILSAIDQEIERAQAELRAATVARHAEKYNALMAQQRSLVQTIEEAIDTIVKAVEVKEGLATKQKNLQTSCNFLTPYPLHAASDLRHIVLREITAQLHQPPGVRRPLQPLDWSSLEMSEHGMLLE